MKQEEAEGITCRVAFLDRRSPDPKPPQRVVSDRWRFFPLGHDLPFTVRNLVKLSKAVDPWSSTIAVDTNDENELRIWGLIDQTVHHNTFIVKESEIGAEPPGLFQAVIEGVGEIAVYRKYTFLGRLRQDALITRQLQVLSEAGPIRAKVQPAINNLIARVRNEVGHKEYDRRGHWDATLADVWTAALSRILIGIQRYGHGGAVFLSDASSGLTSRYAMRYPRLSEALYRRQVLQVQKTSYSDEIHELYLEMEVASLPIDLYLNEAVSENEIDNIEHEITGCIRFLTSLSRIDGLIWFRHNLTLEGFGVLIETEEEPGNVYRANDVQGRVSTKIDIHNFGTRHRSMMRQCWKDPNGVGFVISQDGDVRAFTKSKGKILMWESIGLHRVSNARTGRQSLSSHALSVRPFKMYGDD